MSGPEDGGLYPIFLKLAGREVLVVGGGPVAERKVESLLQAGARVRVVAVDVTGGLAELASAGSIALERRAFADADAEGAWLVIAATSNADVQGAVQAAASARSTFVIAVDDVTHATAYSGAIVRRPPFTIAISSSGETPALTRLLREVIESVIPPDDWIAHAKAIRARWIAERTPFGDRFGQLVKELAARMA